MGIATGRRNRREKRNDIEPIRMLLFDKSAQFGQHDQASPFTHGHGDGFGHVGGLSTRRDRHSSDEVRIAAHHGGPMFGRFP